MKSKYNYINVVDVEATCFGGKPHPEKSEIIEIGICCLDAKEMVPMKASNASIFIKPEETEISEYCTNLTHITKDMIDTSGISFREACSILTEKYLSKNHVWASWGNYDRRIFMDNCKKKNIKYPFGVEHINVKTLFALMHRIKPVGMEEALKIIRIPLEGTHHRGVDDAYNIAVILSSLLRENKVQ